MKDYAELEKRLEARAFREGAYHARGDNALLLTEAAAAISDLTKRLEEADERARRIACSKVAGEPLSDGDREWCQALLSRASDEGETV